MPFLEEDFEPVDLTRTRSAAPPPVPAGQARIDCREVEGVVGVVGLLDLLQPRQVGPVVGLLPVGERRVDVVLVGALCRPA